MLAAMNHRVNPARLSESKDWENSPKDVVGHDLRPCFIRVNSVTLVHRGNAGHAIQQERDERDVLFPRDGGKHRPERSRIAFTEVWRGLHLGEQDFRTGKDRFHPTDNGPNGRARGIDVLPPKPIVRAGLDHHHVRRVAQQPFDAAKRAGRRLTAESGVDDAERDTRRVQLPLQDRWIGAVWIESESRRQRRADNQQCRA